MGRAKGEKTPSAVQNNNSAEQKSDQAAAHFESNRSSSALDTPEMRRELADFVKLIGRIQTESARNTQLLDNDPRNQ